MSNSTAILEAALLDPSVYANLPGLAPPPGVVPNFVDPPDRGYTLIIVGAVLMALMVLFFMIRLYTKCFVSKRFSWDDLTCTLAVLGAVAYYGNAVWAVTMGPAGKHQWDVTLGDVLSNTFLVSTYLGIVLMCPILLVVKLTFFLLYLEIFRPMRWLRLSVYVGTISLTLFYGAYSIALFVIATPSPGQSWQVHTFSNTERFNAYTAVIYLAAGAPASYSSQGWGYLNILTGILACLASLLSIYYRVVDNTTEDTTWNILNVGLMALIEMQIGVICSCMPSISKMLQQNPPIQRTLRRLFMPQSDALLVSTSKSRKSLRARLRKPAGLSCSTGHTSLGSFDYPPTPPPKDVWMVPRPRDELTHVKCVRTHIWSGRYRVTSDDGIYLTHDLQQSWEEPQENIAESLKMEESKTIEAS